MNYRQSWGSFSQDKMVSWDITVNVTGFEEACNEAGVFWGNFQDMTPLIGYVNMFNIDQVPTIFLEVTNSEALRILSRQRVHHLGVDSGPQYCKHHHEELHHHGLGGLG